MTYIISRSAKFRVYKSILTPDVSYDYESLYNGINFLNNLDSELGAFSLALSGVDLSGTDLSTASLLVDVKSKVFEVKNSTIGELILKTNNIKNIIVENDQQALLYFDSIENEDNCEFGNIVDVEVEENEKSDILGSFFDKVKDGAFSLYDKVSGWYNNYMEKEKIQVELDTDIRQYQVDAINDGAKTLYDNYVKFNALENETEDKIRQYQVDIFADDVKTLYDKIVKCNTTKNEIENEVEQYQIENRKDNIINLGKNFVSLCEKIWNGSVYLGQITYNKDLNEVTQQRYYSALLQGDEEKANNILDYYESVKAIPSEEITQNIEETFKKTGHYILNSGEKIIDGFSYWGQILNIQQLNQTKENLYYNYILFGNEEKANNISNYYDEEKKVTTDSIRNFIVKDFIDDDKYEESDLLDSSTAVALHALDKTGFFNTFISFLAGTGERSQEILSDENFDFERSAADIFLFGSAKTANNYATGKGIYEGVNGLFSLVKLTNKLGFKELFVETMGNVWFKKGSWKSIFFDTFTSSDMYAESVSILIDDIVYKIPETADEDKKIVYASLGIQLALIVGAEFLGNILGETAENSAVSRFNELENLVIKLDEEINLGEINEKSFLEEFGFGVEEMKIDDSVDVLKQNQTKALKTLEKWKDVLESFSVEDSDELFEEYDELVDVNLKKLFKRKDGLFSFLNDSLAGEVGVYADDKKGDIHDVILDLIKNENK